VRVHGKTAFVQGRIIPAKVIKQQKGVKAGQFGVAEDPHQVHARAFGDWLGLEDIADWSIRGHWRHPVYV